MDGIIAEKKKPIFVVWLHIVIIGSFLLFGVVALIDVVIDPYFHYHKPIVNYRLYNERYINDGIARNFEYDSIIIGNSLAQNYKTSQFDELYDAHSIKLPYSGAGMKELWMSLGNAIGREAVDVDDNISVWEYGFTADDIDKDEYEYRKGYNDQVSLVLMTMDIEDVMLPYYWSRYKYYPEYLTNDSVLDDIYYLLNKDVFYRGSLYNIAMTIKGQDSTSFDEYSAWAHECGRDNVMSELDRFDTLDNRRVWRLEGFEEEKLKQMLSYNIIPVIEANPDVTFMIVLPPRSIAKWAEFNVEGGVDFRIDGLEYVLSALTQFDNVVFYGFDDQYDIVVDFNRFSDLIHYDSDVNEWMMKEMSLGHHMVNKDNYKEYISEIRKFYSDYDYQSLKY